MHVGMGVKNYRREEAIDFCEEILSRIFGPKKNTENNEYERR